MQLLKEAVMMRAMGINKKHDTPEKSKKKKKKDDSDFTSDEESD